MSPRPAETRRLVGRYRLDAELGRGAMGTVWSAYDEVLHRPVAVKEVRLSLVPVSERAIVRERTLREARATAMLSHPNVVTLYDVVEVDSEPYVVMELLPSRSLASYIAERGTLSQAETAEIGSAVASALMTAHRAGITHRDVKPGNVLIGTDGQIKLTDFGIARNAAESSMTQTGTVLGSPPYIAPEVAMGRAVGPPADLWGLGATLFACLEGRPPYDAGDPVSTVSAVVHGEIPRPKGHGPVVDVVRGLMVKDPTLRMPLPAVRRRLRPLMADPEGPMLSAPPAPATTEFRLPQAPSNPPSNPPADDARSGLIRAQGRSGTLVEGADAAAPSPAPRRPAPTPPAARTAPLTSAPTEEPADPESGESATPGGGSPTTGAAGPGASRDDAPAAAVAPAPPDDDEAADPDEPGAAAGAGAPEDDEAPDDEAADGAAGTPTTGGAAPGPGVAGRAGPDDGSVSTAADADGSGPHDVAPGSTPAAHDTGTSGGTGDGAAAAAGTALAAGAAAASGRTRADRTAAPAPDTGGPATAPDEHDGADAADATDDEAPGADAAAERTGSGAAAAPAEPEGAVTGERATADAATADSDDESGDPPAAERDGGDPDTDPDDSPTGNDTPGPPTSTPSSGTPAPGTPSSGTPAPGTGRPPTPPGGTSRATTPSSGFSRTPTPSAGTAVPEPTAAETTMVTPRLPESARPGPRPGPSTPGAWSQPYQRPPRAPMAAPVRPGAPQALAADPGPLPFAPSRRPTPGPSRARRVGIVVLVVLLALAGLVGGYAATRLIGGQPAFSVSLAPQGPVVDGERMVTHSDDDARYSGTGMGFTSLVPSTWQQFRLQQPGGDIVVRYVSDDADRELRIDRLVGFYPAQRAAGYAALLAQPSRLGADAVRVEPLTVVAPARPGAAEPVEQTVYRARSGTTDDRTTWTRLIPSGADLWVIRMTAPSTAPGGAPQQFAVIADSFVPPV